jgi:leucyl aminopeptidase (aminopeptidase T)
MEDYGPRPMLELPRRSRRRSSGADVSIYAGQPKTGELAFRRALTKIVDRRQIRHAHMVSISRQIMCEAMRADFNEVDAISRRIRDRAEKAEKIVARSRAGSYIQATFDPRIKWLKTSGIISTAKWGNLPGGEVLTAPARVDGVYVADGVVGEYLCARYGDLENTPLFVTIENSRITEVRCANQDLVNDFQAYTSTDENSNRVGEFAIGHQHRRLTTSSATSSRTRSSRPSTSPSAIPTPSTPARNGATTHIDIVGRHFDIWFDVDQIMKAGKFLI